MTDLPTAMNNLLQSRWLPLVLLTCSNIFMTFAWYGHLKFRHLPLWVVVLVSWGIAFFEYCLMVPANRWGYGRYSAIELKILQEVITLSVFSGFVIAYLGERIRWNHLAAFMCIVAAVAFAFLPERSAASHRSAPATADRSDEKGMSSP
jgi:uncharacterized protein (DUF486 family)